jgi:hypothetical protein
MASMANGELVVKILVHGLDDSCQWHTAIDPATLEFPGLSCRVNQDDWFMASFQEHCAILDAWAWNEIDNVRPDAAWMDCAV